MSVFELGERVTVNATLTRSFDPGHLAHPETRMKLDEARAKGPIRSEKVWLTSPLDDPIKGIIVGKRILSDGFVVGYTAEHAEKYMSVRHFTAWVVAYNLRSVTILALSSDMTTEVPPPSGVGA